MANERCYYINDSLHMKSTISSDDREVSLCLDNERIRESSGEGTERDIISNENGDLMN